MELSPTKADTDSIRDEMITPLSDSSPTTKGKPRTAPEAYGVLYYKVE